MTISKKILAGAVAASLAVSAMAPVANAEVSASVGVASSYLWRGIDLGAGTPAISGDLSFSSAGFYAGTWVSSGDAANGTEYDLYLGYGGEAGDFSYDVSLWSYQYPTAVGVTEDLEVYDASNDVGDLAEAVVSLGYGPVSISYYHGLQDLEDYYYVNAGLALGDFGVNLGAHEDDMMHLDVSYSYNDNLSFTLSQVIDDVDGAYDDDLNIVVSYSMPIE